MLHPETIARDLQRSKIVKDILVRQAERIANGGDLPDDYDAFPWLDQGFGSGDAFESVKTGKDARSAEVIPVRALADVTSEVRRAPTLSFRDTIRTKLPHVAALAITSLSMLTACIGPFAPQPQPGREVPAVSQQEPTPTRGPDADQDYSKYEKYLTNLTFPTEDPDYGWKAHKGGKVEAYLAKFYGATGEDDAFDPHRDALSYEERKAGDPEHFANRYNAGLEFFKKLNAGLGSYPDDDPWVHIRSSENKVVNFNTLTREGWKEFFEAHGGEYVPQATGTPAQAEPAAPAAESRGATSVSGHDRLQGGLGAHYIKNATDGDISITGNYTRSLETNRILREYHQSQGRERINEIGVTTGENFAQLVSERIQGVNKGALESMFAAGKHKIAYNASGVLKFTDIILTDGPTNENTHQISRKEKVLAIEIIYKDGRHEIAAIRVMCDQEFEEKVPVVQVTPTATRIPAQTLVPGKPGIPVAAPPAATLRPPRGVQEVAQPAPAQPRFEAPAAPITYEQLPSPVQAFIRRTLPPGQQAIIKLFDTNNNGICEPGDLPPQNVGGVVFAIEFLTQRDGFLAPERRIVYTNSSGVALGDFRPNGEPFRVFEFVPQGQTLLYAQPGRAGQFGVSEFDPNRARPAVFCNATDRTPTPTNAPTPTGTPTPPATQTPPATNTVVPPTGTPPTGETATATPTPRIPPTQPPVSTVNTPPPATATGTATREATPTTAPTQEKTPTPRIPPTQPPVSTVNTPAVVAPPTTRPVATGGVL